MLELLMLGMCLAVVDEAVATVTLSDGYQMARGVDDSNVLVKRPNMRK